MTSSGGPSVASVSHPIDRLARSGPLTALADALADGRRIVATGAAGSSTALVAAAASQRLERPVLLVLAHLDDADTAAEELREAGAACTLLPAMEQIAGEDATTAELFLARVLAARVAVRQSATEPRVYAASIASLMQYVPTRDRASELTMSLARGATLDPRTLIKWLGSSGYQRLDAIEEPGDFAVRGGIVDVFPFGGATPSGPLTTPIRLDFFGDEIDRLHEIDLDTMGSDRAIESVEIVASAETASGPALGESFVDLLPTETVAIVAETLEVVEQGRGFFERSTDGRRIMGPPEVLKRLETRLSAFAEINQFSAGAATADARLTLPVEPLPSFSRELSEAMGELASMPVTARVVACQNKGERERLTEVIAEAAAPLDVEIIDCFIDRGFIYRSSDADALAVVPYHELIHRFEARRGIGGIRAGRAMDTFVDLAVGDHVVHQDHGIAKFIGIEIMPAGTASRRERSLKTDGKAKRDETLEEYLTLEFAGASRLHVPATQIDLVQKYVGGFAGKPPLSTIGGTKWKNAKQRVEGSVRDLAGEMLRVRAAREHMPGIRYPSDTTWQREFEAEFPYQETEDQLAALSEIKRDMSAERPMDRLICGDVGFGKTEVAIRAAFKACEFGKQVAVLVPTTVLAEQHERTFRSRFADYPFRVESLSRFKTTKEVNDTLAKLRRGELDVIIGTHRLLSKDVKFADLGMVVIDEEQRFGVEHKERLLQLRMTVDVLTLSATPIPRTLHMAMLGLRDISSLTTPPLDRRAIVTDVVPYNARRVKQAIERELAREGQCFFVHNRVHNIKTWADELHKLVPDARIVVGHGQMSPKELEQVMLTFSRREADILVATTIIESGIDIASANTMFINEADRFGLADLHQLRGRVGRSKHRGYCYLLLPADRTVKEVAQKRLKAIEQYSMLGAGFKIAMRDLEIRGAGNLLGAEQSGHIAAVGYELFCRLLETAVRDLRAEPEPPAASRVSVDIGIHGLIPRVYIPSDVRRMEAYRRMASATSEAHIDATEQDLREAYGAPPKAVDRLLDLARLRYRAASYDARAVVRRGPDVVFTTAAPQPIADALKGGPGDVRVVSAELAQTNTRSLSGEALAEVYLRLNDAALEPESLLRILLHRLSSRDTGTSTDPSPKVDSSPASGRGSR